MKAPCSGPICMPAASGKVLTVSAASWLSTASRWELCATT